MNNLSDLIKEKRNKLNISQRELAKKINVDNSLISRIESGEVQKPNLFILFNLSETLDISIVKLLKACNYEGFDVELLNNLQDFEFLGSSEKLYKRYCNSKNEIDLNKVVDDYKQNKIGELEAFSIFYKCLGLYDRGIINLALMYYLFRNDEK